LNRAAIPYIPLFFQERKSMSFKRKAIVSLMSLTLAVAAHAASAKQTVKIAFIGPLTGGVSANGIGGRNSADLAVRLRNQDEKA